MAHTPHELAEEFPEHAEKMHDLKLSDAHFARLADDYHAINRTIHRVETGAAATVFAGVSPEYRCQRAPNGYKTKDVNFREELSAKNQNKHQYEC